METFCTDASKGNILHEYETDKGVSNEVSHLIYLGWGVTQTSEGVILDVFTGMKITKMVSAKRVGVFTLQALAEIHMFQIRGSHVMCLWER